MNPLQCLTISSIFHLIFCVAWSYSASLGLERHEGVEEIELTAADAIEGQHFGRDVGISGALAVVGAPHGMQAGERTGAAYIFRQTEGSWHQEAKLIASDAARGDYFGFAVDISGDTAVVGAFHDDDARSGSGSAYVFVYDGNEWQEQAKLTAADASKGDGFGRSIAIEGDRVVVGARQEDTVGPDSGAAYLFQRHGTQWQQEAKLTAGETARELDEFGTSVDVDGDTIVVGTRIDKDSGVIEAGKAYVFVRTEATWAAEAVLQASDGLADDWFGFSVAVRGDTVVVGAPRNKHAGSLSGAAYIFTRNATQWEETARLTASDPARGDSFAYAVDITEDEQTLVLGAHRDDDYGSQSGSVYVFLRDLDGINWVEFMKLNHSDAGRDDMLGRFLAVGRDEIIAGAYRHNHRNAGFMSGGAYVFRGWLAP